MNALTRCPTTEAASPIDLVKTIIAEAVDSPKQPSEWELVRLVEGRCGIKLRWLIRQALEGPTGEGQLTLLSVPRTNHIAKTAGLLERMAQQTLPPRPDKKPRGARR